MSGRLGLPRGRALLLDSGLVVVFVVLLVDRVFIGLGTTTDVAGSPWWTFPLFLAGDVAMLWRRSRPALAVSAFYGAYAAHALITSAGVEGAFALLPALTGLASLGAYADRRRLATGLAAVVALSAVHDTRDSALQLSDDTEVWSYLMWTAVLVLFLLAGVLLRTSRAATAQREAMLLAEAERAEALASERAKIARDLHDVVTHNVNVVVMQAMAATGVLDSDPSRVRAPLAAIETSGREALAEMRRMLGVLREEDELLLTPQPGVTGIERLADSLSSAGQPVTCSVEDAARVLPEAVGMVLFRIAQEALTNAMKHARGAAVAIAVRRTATAVELDVVNGAGDGEGERTGAGHGLVGMAERAVLFGGHVDARPLPDGGFRVFAQVPVDP